MKNLLLTWTFALLFMSSGYSQWNATSGTIGLGDQYGLAFGSENYVYAAGGSGGWVSADMGETWTKVVETGDYYVPAVGTGSDGAVYFCRHKVMDTAYLLKSTDGGVNFTTLLKRKNYTFIQVMETSTGAILVSGSTFMSTFFIFRTENQVDWTEITLPYKILQLKRYGDKIYAATQGTNGGIYVSEDDGVNFSPINTGLPLTAHSMCKAPNGDLFAGAYESNSVGTIYKSTDGGANWNLVFTGSAYRPIYDLEATPDGHIYAAISLNGFKHSSDAGSTWDDISDGAYDIMQCEPGSNGKIYAIKQGHLAYYDAGSAVNQIETRYISVFPNPATDYISISNMTALNTPYFITDITGKIIVSGLTSSAVINIKYLDKGMYFLVTDNFKAKFIKE